jgi:PAS domain S-box-containing protein
MPTPPPAAQETDRAVRAPAFDALGEPAERRSRHAWLPFAALAAIVLLMAGLFLAMLAEDRQLQREALRRDFDSAAQQLSARLVSLSEAVSAAALEVGAQTLGERRFASFANDLAAAKPEVQRIKFVNAEGRLIWEPAPAGPVPMLPDDAVDVGFVPLLTEARQAPDVIWRVLPSDSRAATLALVVPVYTEGTYAGALLVRVSPTTLLRSLSAETLDRYRVQLLADGAVLAATTASEPAPRASTYAAPLAPLPPSIILQASAFRTPSPLTGTAPVWLVGALTIAVVVALFALLRYTTRLVRADRALVAETSLRRAMENSLATGLRVLDGEGVTRYVNRAFCDMTGWKEADLLGRGPPFPYWPPELIAEHQAKLAEILAGTTDKHGFEAVVQRPDGSRFDARLYVSPLVDESGAQIGWVTSMTDITEQKRNRDALAAAHDRFTTVLESLQAAVSVVATGPESGHELLFANRAYQQEFAHDAAGHHRLAAELGGGEADSAGEVQDRSTGRWYDVRMRALRWVDGRAAILQVASDITLRKATDEIVRQQQDKVQFTSRLMTMGEMASSLAHELNQPLTAITNYSEGALARMASGQARIDDLRPALEKVSAQAQRAGRIIRRIREFVKRSEPRRRPTAAARIIEDAVAFAEIEASKKGIAIVVSVAPGLPELDVDPILIEQVLLNLLKNAIDAMDHAVVRQIDVVARSAGGGMAQIEVIDRGSGIPEAHVASLFEPFFSTKSEGMGMGLNICRSIVEFHHGRLHVAPNLGPPGGTIMRFTLPLATEDLDDQNAVAISAVGAVASNATDGTER